MTRPNTLVQQFRRAGVDWVRIPLVGGPQAVLTWMDSHCPVEVEPALDQLLGLHDRTQRITGTWKVSPGRRPPSSLKLVAQGWRHPEEVAEEAERIGIQVAWLNFNEFEVRGTDQELEFYLSVMAA